MPDKMPEDMSDRMPEDLPVTKRIDVMVGITRNKVICMICCAVMIVPWQSFAMHRTQSCGLLPVAAGR